MKKVSQLHDLGVARQKYLTCTIWGGTPFLAWQKGLLYKAISQSEAHSKVLDPLAKDPKGSCREHGD
jgi:hypothetical protein